MTKLVAPPDIHEGVVEKHRLRNRNNGAPEPDVAIDALAGALLQARTSTEQIIALVDAVHKDATLTPAAQAVRIRGTVIKLAERATQGLDAARARAQQELEELQAVMAIPQPRDMMEIARHQEIRSRFTSLPENERQDQLAAAMAAGQERVVNAILGAESFLTGMSQSEHAMRLGQWQAERHPAAIERLNRIKKALAATERGGATFLKFVEAQVTSPGQEMAEANRKHAEEIIAAARAE